MFHNVKKNVRFSTDILVMQVSFFSCRHCSLKKPGDDGITLGIYKLSESSFYNLYLKPIVISFVDYQHIKK